MITSILLMQVELQKGLKKDKHVHVLLAQYNKLTNELVEVLFALPEIIAAFKHGEMQFQLQADLQSFQESYRRFLNSRRTLALLSSKDPFEKELFYKFESNFSGVEKGLKQQRFETMGSLLKKVKNNSSFSAGIRSYRNYCVSAVEQNRKHQSLLRSRLSSWIYIGLVLDFCIALTLLAFLNRDLKTRLEKAKENTQRIARNETLLPSCSGDDEISRFDRSLHEMYQSLQSLKESKHQFFSMITHDFRTPLAGVLANLQSMRLQLNQEDLKDLDSDELKTCLQELETSADLIAQRVDKLLIFEKLLSANSRPELASHDLSDFLEEAVEQSTSRANRLELEINVFWPSCDLQVRIDRDKAVLSLENLISYTLSQASLAGKKSISIRCNYRPEENEVDILIPHFMELPQERLQEFIHERGESPEIDLSGLSAIDLSLLIAKLSFGRMGCKTAWQNEPNSPLQIKVTLPVQVLPELASKEQ